MPISQVGSGETAADASGASAVVSKPSGVTSGDLLIATVASNENTITLPSGFSSNVLMQDTGTTNLYQTIVCYKIAGGSEPSSYEFSKGTPGGAPLVVILSAWRGVDNANPFEDTSTARDNGFGTGNPNPNVSFTQEEPGRLFYLRSSRVEGSSLSYTNSVHAASWGTVAQVSQYSGGTVTYGMIQVAHLTDTAGTGGNRSEPTITTSQTTADNMYFLACMRENVAKTVDAGDVSGSTTTNSPTPGVKVNAIGVGV